LDACPELVEWIRYSKDEKLKAKSFVQPSHYEGRLERGQRVIHRKYGEEVSISFEKRDLSQTKRSSAFLLMGLDCSSKK
jgi:hypothetical protein